MPLSVNKPGKFSLSVKLVASAVIFVVLAIEFSTDLSKEIFWYRIVTGLDVTLVAGYVAIVVKNAVRNRKYFVAWILLNRVEVLILVIVILVLPIPRVSAAILMARMLANLLFYSIDTALGRRLAEHVHLRPSQTLALSFLGLIAVSTVLLLFPAATADGKGSGFLDSLFIITSAACVVGLSVVDVGSFFSFFGQAVILGTIQVGGLGIMVLSAAFAVLIGANLQTKQRAGLSALFDISTTSGLKSLVKTVAAGTFFAEILGAIVLFFSWGIEFSTFGERLWWSIFHAVSAFCNAGFSLTANSLIAWVGNIWICSAIMLLITFGGLGFFVISDVVDAENWRVKRPGAIWNRLHMQTKVVLIATVFLDLAGMLLFLYFEYNGVLFDLSIAEKISASLFHSVSARTAGFTVIQIDAIAPATLLISIVWMFIGASPGSTGGGIKTTTLAVALMAIRAMLTDSKEVELMGRRIPSVIINRSLSIILISCVAIIFFFLWMIATQPLPFDKLLFEIVSAFATVGWSLDITSRLDEIGRVLTILLMFVGRIGPLTLALAIGERKTRAQGYRLVKGQLAVG